MLPLRTSNTMEARSISTLAKHCSELLARWLDSVGRFPDQVLQVENLLFRFNLWAENNSAFSEGRDSLDWRLRKASLPHNVIVDLLEDLSAVVLGHVAPKQSEVDQHENAGTLLDQLFRFTRAVRRSGALKRFVRAADYFELVEIDGIVVNLTLKFREGVQAYLDMMFKSTSQELRGRLLETICLRQQNFAYLRSKRKKGSSHVAPRRSASQTGSRLGSAFSTTGRSTNQSQRSAQHQPASDRKRDDKAKRRAAPASATTFNTNALPTIDGPTLDKPEADYALEDLPRRPKILPATRHKEVECPYCLLACDHTEFTDAGWPRHVIQDLMPFICVQERCHVPNSLYGSTAAWMSHMKTEHARHGWICMDRSHTSSVQFTDILEFRRHMQEHEDDLSEGELDNIVEESYGVLSSGDVFDECPLCDEYNDEAPDSIDLEHHISSHLLMLSQISLSGHDLGSDMELESESDHTTSQGRIPSDVASAQQSRQLTGSHADSRDETNSQYRDEQPEEQQNTGVDNHGNVPEESEIISSNPGDWEFMRARKFAYDPSTDKVVKRFAEALRLGEEYRSPYPDRGARVDRGLDVDNLDEAEGVEQRTPMEGPAQIEVDTRFSAKDGSSPARHSGGRFLVAIHVGTTCASVAYADIDEGDKQRIAVHWDAEFTTEQVSTTLYGETDEAGLTSWRWRPPLKRRSSSTLELDITPPEPPILKSFKLGVFPSSYPSFASRMARQHLAKASWRTRGQCLNLMTDYLKTLKSTIDDVVIEANGGRAEDPLVDYILTVPELWESNERESLRECAAEALLGYGSMKEAVAIIGEQSVQQSLQLIVESEALVTFIVASIPPTGVEKGDLFLICDAGGCMVTVSTYEIRSSKLALRRNIVDSGVLGDTLLDGTFEDYLRSKEGLKHIDWDQGNGRRLMEHAIANFNAEIKHAFDGVDERAPFVISAGPVMDDDFVISIQAAEIRTKVFDPVVSGICDLIHDHMNVAELQRLSERNRGVRTLYLAGGFGENEYLKKRIQATVGNEVRVVRIAHSRTAVVRGALMEGQRRARQRGRYPSQPLTVEPRGPVQPPRVISRKANRHYGIREVVEYDPQNPLHSVDRRIRSAGSWTIEVMKWRSDLGERTEIPCDIYTSDDDIAPPFPHTETHPVPGLERPACTIEISVNKMSMLRSERFSYVVLTCDVSMVFNPNTATILIYAHGGR
ncbi:hypothetical protein Purlil1_10999 [Purpureocillium lilacinum]|uniref:Hsp70 family chaperone n=1 Tax=Purpureocillium lilacinum TaxID=33203 RepID=A0ABR0BM37_PURLI|nr:hypothetical protein Purlil1_10999 [Purpureocillium lilacinum]